MEWIKLGEMKSIDKSADINLQSTDLEEKLQDTSYVEKITEEIFNLVSGGDLETEERDYNWGLPAQALTYIYGYITMKSGNKDLYTGNQKIKDIFYNAIEEQIAVKYAEDYNDGIVNLEIQEMDFDIDKGEIKIEFVID